MSRPDPPWFAAAADAELSAVERERLRNARRNRLDQHMLGPKRPGSPGPQTPGTRVLIPQLRDPLDLHSGLDITYLSESAFVELFPLPNK